MHVLGIVQSGSVFQETLRNGTGDRLAGKQGHRHGGQLRGEGFRMYRGLIIC